MNRMTKKVLSQGLFLFFFSLATTGWLAAQAGKTIDFSTLVVVGDSLAAGVQNGSLEDVQQVHGFANVIAGQIPTNLVMPLVPAPGAPNTLELISAGFPPDIQPTPGTLPFLRDDFLSPVTDVAVPLQTVADALTRFQARTSPQPMRLNWRLTLFWDFPAPCWVSLASHSPRSSRLCIASHNHHR